MTYLMEDGGWLGANSKRYDSREEAEASLRPWAKPNFTPEQQQAERLSVFLSYGHEDRETVATIRKQLLGAGTAPWMDKYDIEPGVVWAKEIDTTIARCHAFLACVSAATVTRDGYTRQEIQRALRRAINLPEGRVFIIPVRLDDCAVPSDLAHLQWVDYFEPDGAARLKKTLRSLTEHLNAKGSHLTVV